MKSLKFFIYQCTQVDTHSLTLRLNITNLFLSLTHKQNTDSRHSFILSSFFQNVLLPDPNMKSNNFISGKQRKYPFPNLKDIRGAYTELFRGGGTGLQFNFLARVSFKKKSLHIISKP